MTGRYIEVDESKPRTTNIDVTVKIVSSGESTELMPRSATSTTLHSSVSQDSPSEGTAENADTEIKKANEETTFPRQSMQV